MSIYKMRNGKPCTMKDYAVAFKEVEEGATGLSLGAVLPYMRYDKQNAAYLGTEVLRLAQLWEHPKIAGHYRSPFCLVRGNDGDVYDRILRASIPNYYKEIADQAKTQGFEPVLSSYAGLTFVSASCIVCENREARYALTIGPERNYEYHMRHFDTSDPVTRLAVQSYYLSHHNTPIGLTASVAAICDDCYKPCDGCGKNMPMPLVQSQVLESYTINRSCVLCAGISIAMLEPPKPNMRELKAYRYKLTAWGKEVR